MNNELVTVEKYQFLPQAESARIAMQSAGIETFLADAETVNTDWMLGNAVGYIKLQVRQSQADAALEILDQMRIRRDEREILLGSADPEKCLACGAELRPKNPECPQCGWSYAADDEVRDQDIAATPPHDGEPIATGEDPLTGDEPEAGGSVMTNLLSLKRPLIILFLIPFAAGIVTLTLYFVMWFCDLITGS